MIPVNGLLKRFRKICRPDRYTKSLIIRKNKYRCCRCKTTIGKSGQVHHVKPVWAYFIIACASMLPETKNDLMPIVYYYPGLVQERDGIIRECNQLSNLTYLCTPCHRIVEKETRQEWREKIDLFYPDMVFYSNKNLTQP